MSFLSSVSIINVRIKKTDRQISKKNIPQSLYKKEGGGSLLFL